MILLRLAFLAAGMDIIGTIIGNPHQPRIKLPNHYYVQLDGHVGVWLLVGIVFLAVSLAPSGKK